MHKRRFRLTARMSRKSTVRLLPSEIGKERLGFGREGRLAQKDEYHSDWLPEEKKKSFDLMPGVNRTTKAGIKSIAWGESSCFC